MRRFILSAIAVIFICLPAVVNADDAEDLRFARELLRRKWFDWADEVVVKLIESSRTSTNIKGWAADLHVAIVMARAKETGNKLLHQKAEALMEKYKRMFPSHPAWAPHPPCFPPGSIFWALNRARELSEKSEIERDKNKRSALKKEAAKLFEQVQPAFERHINRCRLEAAKYPPQEKWGEWSKNASTHEQQKLLDTVWQRDFGEHLYATSFIHYARVVPEEKKKEILEKGIRKLNRFLEGTPENETDSDPPAKGQK